MLRVRFHGRGGQGMKTASRILGSAAFRAGFTAQDSPVYGAERRGAPMLAFTRIAREQIRERGSIARPDLVVVADDTLLSDPAVQPLAGCGADCTLLLNSTKDAATVQRDLPQGSRLLVADFTTLALERTGALASLSTALGVAAARLVGLSLDPILAGLKDELADTPLSPAQKTANLQLGQAVYSLAEAWTPVHERAEEVSPPVAPELVEVGFDPPRVAAPTIYAVSNSPERRTGNWRQFRPLLHAERCTRCWICFVRCPEAAISLDAQDYPIVDYDVCKGCLLCVHECPTHAFTVETEER